MPFYPEITTRKSIIREEASDHANPTEAWLNPEAFEWRTARLGTWSPRITTFKKNDARSKNVSKSLKLKFYSIYLNIKKIQSNWVT